MAKREREPTEITEESIAAEIPEGWAEDAVGFPPYWNPGLGKHFTGVVMNRDDRDPEFIRYTIQATQPLECATGPADDAEIVMVNVGENFSCSAYAALPLDSYFGFEIKVLCFKTRKLPGNDASDNTPRDLWQFKVLLPPDTKRLLDSVRKKEADILRNRVREARLNQINTSGTKVPKNLNDAAENFDRAL